MLEGRIRLHWAARAFLWFVRVPTNKVTEKQEQYKGAPEAGSVIVHDDAEADMTAVKRMIGTGTGFPPHWLGEPGDVNLSTAQARQEPAERPRLSLYLWSAVATPWFSWHMSISFGQSAMPAKDSFWLKDTNQTAKLFDRPIGLFLKIGREHGQSQFLGSIWLDGLVQMALQNTQLLAQNQDF